MHFLQTCDATIKYVYRIYYSTIKIGTCQMTEDFLCLNWFLVQNKSSGKKIKNKKQIILLTSNTTNDWAISRGFPPRNYPLYLGYFISWLKHTNVFALSDCYFKI